MIGLLAELVAIDSPSADPVAVSRARDRIDAFLAEAGVATRKLPTGAGGADCLIASHHDTGSKRPLLLMGHMDTVFGTGEAARRPFTIRDGRAYGPGVADMKAGLVMNAFLMAALSRHRVPLSIRALFTVDEEIGSPASHKVIEDVASQAAFVFNSEPGRSNGDIVRARRGGAFYRVCLTGRAAHAGLNPDQGRSAILALAMKILDWQALNDPEQGISVSTGLISGGRAVNMIAPCAEAQIDLRFGSNETGQKAEDALRDVAMMSHVEGVSATFEVLGKFLPMTETDRSRAFVETYLDAARVGGVKREDGREIAAAFTPSCSDAGLSSSLGVPTICACGPVGGGAHSEEEYLEVATIVPRTLAVFDTIARL
ncbi:M20 family metallopeptidase [Pseudogemmobacter sonorensis]|uniref:M20 family metallopeptidase n=1 Tax=Pseudogemmobacter sonorensis TaxID=2989681 RepID=UPI0036BE3DBB